MAASGIFQRHGNRCTGTARCDCPWQASVYSQHDGKKIRKAFPTKAAAVAWRRDSLSAVQKQEMRAPTSETVREAFSAWLKGARDGVIRNRSGDVYKPSAIRAYDESMRLRVLDRIGNRRLTEITRNDLQDIVDELLAEGRSASTIGVSMLPLRAVYKRALSRGEISVNPTAGLDLPRVRGGRDRIATPAECAALLEALPAADRALWAAAMYGGLRRGELMALKVEDIDLNAGLIHVRRGWDAKEGEIATKSGKDRRVPIAAVLRAHLAAKLLSIGWREGLVFGKSPTSPFLGSPAIERADKAWTKAKLGRLTLHEGRHTFASLMIAAGVNAKALSTYMGHANISITLDHYGHLMPGNEEEAAGMLDAYLDRTGTDRGTRITETASVSQNRGR